MQFITNLHPEGKIIILFFYCTGRVRYVIWLYPDTLEHLETAVSRIERGMGHDTLQIARRLDKWLDLYKARLVAQGFTQK